MKTASVAEVQARLFELIGEVAHAGQSLIITKRGRPVARLVPVDASDRPHVAGVKGWMNADDPFFEAVDDIGAERGQHTRRQLDL